ncbi:competence protein CoiA [Streptococcus parauberis]|uniref:competence protein CoiA n=1 Tax=Streptococcus parauberis TaxID=1348 RepID=UPI000CCF5E79|nr:competence protein CoiA family protein [Streptococcus parauberis]PNY20119.1 Competence protein CoiA-like family protein [Streptococcus parauberis]
MLVAIDDLGNRLTTLDNLLKTGIYYCPVCKGQVTLKRGKVKQAHFAHKNLLNCPNSSLNESTEHLLLKAKLYQNLKKSEEVTIETFFPSINQIADLQVNHKLVLEVQCSSLPPDRLVERTKNYRDNDQFIIWLLGKNLWIKHKLSYLQKQFLSFSWSIGFYLWEIDLEKNCLRLCYMIHEDLMGKVTCLTRTCPLDGNLMSFFRMPFQKMNLEPIKVKSDSHLLQKIQKALKYRNKYWMLRQEKAYQMGINLLCLSVEDFYPQYNPPKCEQGFCLIESDLKPFYDAFEAYNKEISNKDVQTLHPPSFYVKI